MNSPMKPYIISLCEKFLPLFVVHFLNSTCERTSLIASEMYQLLDTSDMPSGYVNFLTTKQNSLNKILSEHENIDGIWLFSQSDIDRRKIINNTINKN